MDISDSYLRGFLPCIFAISDLLIFDVLSYFGGLSILDMPLSHGRFLSFVLSYTDFLMVFAVVAFHFNVFDCHFVTATITYIVIQHYSAGNSGSFTGNAVPVV